MAKFSGLVGYGTEVETVPGVWETIIEERMMRGDLIRQNANIRDSGKVNDDITLNHRVSLIGDAYAFDHYYDMKWIQIDQRLWKVSSIEVQRPRLIVEIGGLYHGRQTRASR